MYGHPREAEIVSDRIVETEGFKEFGYLDGCFCIRLLFPGYTYLRCYAVHVNINRHNQNRRLDASPNAWVHLITSDHPTEEQMKTFAGTPQVWIR